MADAHQDNRLVWRKVLAADELPEGRVTSVTCDKRTLCMSHHAGQYGALDNKCPHQGRPLGEGSIENGLLRCPWHGWDYDPITGKAPGFDDRVETFPVEIRDDGVYVGLPTVQTHVSTVGDLMMESLTNWGVKQVFGMVGHSNLGVADALRIQEQAGRLSYYGIRHEGVASFACSAYGKLTGRPAACLSIAGPGATNLLTGLWDANVDRAPVIALTGQVETQVLGPGAFQEIDQVGAFGKVAQWSQTVFHDSRHAELINLACKSAILNRGVSHLIFPDEVPKRALPEPTTAGSPEGRLPSRAISPPADALQAALDLLRASKRPVIVVGHSSRFQMEPVVALAEQLKAPVITTFKAKGQIADSHPLAGGVLGRSGTPIASWLMNESDCLLVFGASFSNHTGISPKKPTIQVDFDLLSLAKFHAVDVPVWGEIGVTAQALSSALAGHCGTQDQTGGVAARWAIWREEKRRRSRDDRGQGLNAAMGAWAATQEDDPAFKGRQVVSVSGDGGFGQRVAWMQRSEIQVSRLVAGLRSPSPGLRFASSGLRAARAPTGELAGDSRYAVSACSLDAAQRNPGSAYRGSPKSDSEKDSGAVPQSAATQPRRMNRWIDEYGQSAARPLSPCLTGL